MSLGSILTALVTPFDTTMKIDEEAFVELLTYVVANGSDGVVVGASTGEPSTLSFQERLQLIQLACIHRPAGAKVIASVGSNDTAIACALADEATELGVDAVLAVAPYYNRPNRRGLILHYGEIARATDKPVILYNVPTRTGINMGPDMLAELAQIDRVDYVKQSNNAELQLIDGLGLYAGNDDIFATTLDLGGCGGVLVASHIAGPQFKQMVTEPAQRHRINSGLKPLYEALAVASNPIPIKCALELLGHRIGGLRLPLVQADEEERQVVQRALCAVGLLKQTGSSDSH